MIDSILPTKLTNNSPTCEISIWSLSFIFKQPIWDQAIKFIHSLYVFNIFYNRKGQNQLGFV